MEKKARLVLLYVKEQRYGKYLETIKKLLDGLEGGQFEIETIDAETLSVPDVERLKSDIRSIPPQVRGRVVSTKGFALPLTRMKNLNIRNTPILILYDSNRRPIDVYPHLHGTAYVGVEEALREMSRRGPTYYFSSRGLLEEPLTKIISEDPSIVEEGMVFTASHLPVSSGIADIVLHDIKGVPVVVEVETTATDRAVGQVCRLAAGFAKDNKLSPSDVRKIIVARRGEGLFKEAALGAGVEVYLLTLRREV